jgi:PAS domain S-box-containing protein
MLVAGCAMDLRHRMKAEEEQSFLNSLLDSVDQAVVVTDMKGKVIYWNSYSEILYGYKKEEAMGMPLSNLVTDDPANARKGKEIMESIKKGNSWSGEFLVKSKRGRIFPVYVTDSPVYDSKGEMKGIIGVSRDITEQVYAKSRILHSMKKLEEQHQLLRNIAFRESHEVRRPLANIKGVMELMKDKPRDEECQKLFALLYQSVQELDEVVRSIVTMAYIEPQDVNTYDLNF